MIGVVHPGIHCKLAHRPHGNRMSDPVSPRAAAPVRIGCAGWAIPSQHAHLFGEGDSHLARYATRFDVAEINSTFYRTHRSQTFERWAASVPAQFRFSAKLPKWITHEARLYGTGGGAYRVEFDVAHDGQQVALTLHQTGLETSLPQRTTAPVSEIEGLHAGLTDPSHGK